MTYHIKDALKKQFDLLSEASEGCVDGEELGSLTHAMLQVCEFLERIEQDEAAQHSAAPTNAAARRRWIPTPRMRRYWPHCAEACMNTEFPRR